MRNFDKQYMQMAEIWAQNSYALKAQVGALIVKNNTIISDGFNGTPAGFENACEYVQEDGTLKTKPYVLHAEANAITKLAKTSQSAEGATIYVTHSPCIDCAKLIIQAGIVRVVYKQLYKNSDGINLLKRAGIKVESLEA